VVVKTFIKLQKILTFYSSKNPEKKVVSTKKKILGSTTIIRRNAT